MRQARVSDVIDDLIEVCREEEASYKACAPLLHKDSQRRLIKRRVQHAARARRQLSKLRDKMGDTSCSGPALSAAGTMRDTARAFGPVSDEASAIGMCERLEAVVLMRYRDALDFELPEPVRKLLQRQFDTMLARHAGDAGSKQARKTQAVKAGATVVLA